MTIVQAIEQIDSEKESLMMTYVKKAGWQHACDSPGSYWYWWVEHNGKRWTCWTLQSAFDMQRRIAAWR